MKTFWQFMEGNFDDELSQIPPDMLEYFDELWDKLLATSGLSSKLAHLNPAVKDWVKKEVFYNREDDPYIDMADLKHVWDLAKDWILANHNKRDFLHKLNDPNFHYWDVEQQEKSKGDECEKVKLQPNQRIHYSKDPNLQLKDFPQQIASDKPRGLWYACDEGWYNYCQSNFGGHRDASITNKYLITLDTSKILTLNSEYKVDEFTHNYWKREANDGYYSNNGYRSIDWNKVAERYAGVECCPYFRELREYFLWYFGWDVPSGCVWDKSGILNIEKVG